MVPPAVPQGVPSEPPIIHRFYRFVRRVTRPVRALAMASVFFLKVFPMLPSRPVDWLTGEPVIEKVTYPTSRGQAAGDVYRPSTKGPHPGILVCLGVVPFEVNHPQVPILGKALARAGLSALLYWSPAMRDFRLDPEDLVNIPLAYHWLVSQEYVDRSRSGLLGTCVGGSFALMASAAPLIQDEVAFFTAYAPYSSMWTLARDIASSSRFDGEKRTAWQVDQLTRKVFIHSLTAMLDPSEACRLMAALDTPYPCVDDVESLSNEGRAVFSLLTARDVEEANAALWGLPDRMQDRLTSLSPVTVLEGLRCQLVVLLHDEGDQLIPVAESRHLMATLAGRPGVHYTEMHFQHLDPLKAKMPVTRMARELCKFFVAMYPLFNLAAGE
jgi:hypothetical protein